MQPYAPAIERLCTIPGINVLTAWTRAETQTDMSIFADDKDIGQLGGLCRGNAQNADKRAEQPDSERQSLDQSGIAPIRLGDHSQEG